MTGRGWRLGLICGVALGIALRVVDFQNCRSLGLDEARLAVNLASRTFLGLLEPLDLDQTAPPLFLWGERLVLLVFGPVDCALRLLPVAAGTLAAVLIYPFARRFVDESQASLATLIGTLCPLLITYSNALKQYSVELLVAILLLLFFQRTLQMEQERGVQLDVLAVGALAPWLSLTSVFVLAAAWLLLADRAFRGRMGAVRLVVASTLAWGASAAAAYARVYRAAGDSAYMQRFWELAFLQPNRTDFAGHAWKSLEDLVWGFVAGDPLADRRPLMWLLHVASVLVVALCGLGVVRVGRNRGWTMAWWLVGPVLLTIVASMLGLFPIAPRLTLFWLPGLIVLFSAGLGKVLLSVLPAGGTRPLAVASTVIVLPMTLHGLVRTISLEPAGHFQHLVSELNQRRKVGEPVYIFARSLPAWIWYSTEWRHPDTTRLRTLLQVARSGGPGFENAPSRSRVSLEEATRLTSMTHTWGEVLGLPSGMEWREVQEHIRAAPDQGWVEVEQRRIREAANPGIWLLASAFYQRESDLFAMLERTAVRRTFALTRPGSALVRYEFTRPAASR